MATQSVPHVISFPLLPKTETISQSELGLLLSLRDRADKIAADVAAAELSIRKRLASGACVEPGTHSASLKEWTRRSVSWKEVAERLAVLHFGARKGAQYAGRVLAGTRPTVSTSLVVE